MDNISPILNSIGLIMGIIGAILIFISTPKMEYGTYIYNREEEVALDKKAKRINQIAKIGAILLFIGFTFQLVSVWI